MILQSLLCGQDFSYDNFVQEIGLLLLQVVGVDYCEEAIQLSLRVAQQAGLEIPFETCDILEDLGQTGCQALRDSYDVVVDKGTFDAISLGEGALEDKRKYVRNMGRLLGPGGVFLITSCNWTAAELRAQFSSGFTVLATLPTPSFSFGGQTGNTVTAVVFKKLAV